MELQTIRFLFYNKFPKFDMLVISVHLLIVILNEIEEVPLQEETHTEPIQGVKRIHAVLSKFFFHKCQITFIY